MVEITRHFTTTTFIVHGDSVLLHKHKKLGIWIPVGGHIDRDELPQDAAVREAKEETGLNIELVSPANPLGIKDEIELIKPFHFMMHNINAFHQHMNMIFYARATSKDLNPQQGESKNFKWLTRAEVEASNELADSVKHCCLELLDLQA